MANTSAELKIKRLVAMTEEAGQEVDMTCKCKLYVVMSKGADEMSAYILGLRCCFWTLASQAPLCVRRKVSTASIGLYFPHCCALYDGMVSGGWFPVVQYVQVRSAYKTDACALHMLYISSGIEF